METVQEVANTQAESAPAPEPAAEVTATSTPPPSSASPGADLPQGSQSVVSAQPQAPAYTPSFKLSAYGKEYEVPESYRALIKDETSEKEVKSIFEKAYAFDTHKTVHEGLKAKYNDYQEKTAPILQLARELDYYQKKGDLGSYFKALGFQDQQILEYALQKAQQLELSPEHKRVYDERESANRQQYMLESQFQQTQERLNGLMVQQRQVELQTVLSRPDVQNFAQAFDNRNGQGSFTDECINQGRSYFALTGQDLSAEEVVQGIVKKFAHPMAQSPMMPQSPKAPAEVPVIPNTGSGSSSPAKKAFKSLDEVRKYKTDNYG